MNLSTNKPILYFSAALLLLAIVVLTQHTDTSRVGDETEHYFIEDYDSADVVRIEVEQLIDSIELRRTEKGWEVSERMTPMRRALINKGGESFPKEKWHRADPSRVANALGSFGGLSEGLVISDDPDRRKIYHVGQTGLAIRLYDEGDSVIADLVIGKNAPDFTSSYIRRSDENEVHRVRRPLMGAFSPSAEDWRERRLWTLEPNTITTMTIAGGKVNNTYEQNAEHHWSCRRCPNATVDQEHLRSFAIKLAFLRADQFADDVSIHKAGLDHPSMTATFTDKKGETRKLNIGLPEGESFYYANVEGIDEIVLIGKEIVELAKDLPREAIKQK